MINITDNGITLDGGTFNIVDEMNIELILKGEFVLDMLAKGYKDAEINKEWNNIAKGYNFIFKLNDMYISVDYLNKVLI